MFLVSKVLHNVVEYAFLSANNILESLKYDLTHDKVFFAVLV